MMNTLIKMVFLIAIINASDLALKSKMPGQKIKFLNIDGQNLKLEELKGEKGTLIIFSCNTCPWVIRWEDRYVDISKKYIPKGIGMVAINSNAAKFDREDSIIEMRSHAAKNKYNFPYVQDKNSKLAKLFGATKTPHIYLFDSKDILVYKGAIDDNARNKNKVKESYLSNALDNMLEGLPIKNSETKALGCSIKFN